MVKFYANLDATSLGLPQGAVKLVVNRTFLEVETKRMPMTDFVAHAGVFRKRAYSDGFLCEAAMEMERGAMCSTDILSDGFDSDNCSFEKLSTEDGSQLSSRKSSSVQQRHFHANPINQYDDCSGQTTVMFRNLPNNYTQDMLMELLEEKGFRACFDFIYLPIDFKKKSGLGYAFINLKSHEDASRAFKVLEGFQNWKGRSQKRLQVCWSSVQGLHANMARYQDRHAMQPAISEKFMPMIFNSGSPMSECGYPVSEFASSHGSPTTTQCCYPVRECQPRSDKPEM